MRPQPCSPFWRQQHSLRSRRLAPERASRIKPGDILRIRKNTHSAVLIQVDGDTLTVCEGNNYGTVHWGRKISASSLAGDITYVERRYVMDSEETAATGQKTSSSEKHSPRDLPGRFHIPGRDVLQRRSQNKSLTITNVAKQAGKSCFPCRL